jgi:hypothetical protein
LYPLGGQFLRFILLAQIQFTGWVGNFSVLFYRLGWQFLTSIFITKPAIDIQSIPIQFALVCELCPLTDLAFNTVSA